MLCRVFYQASRAPMTSLLGDSFKRGTRRVWRLRKLPQKAFQEKKLQEKKRQENQKESSKESPKESLKTSLPFEGFSDLCAETEEQTKAISQLLLEETLGLAAPLPDVVRHIVSAGGKRLRSRLLIASVKLLGCQGEEKILNEAKNKETILLGGAIEAIHCASLLHDDVVDGSKMRRGLPTAHRLWGAQASVLVGDFLFARAFDLMCRQSEIGILTLLSQTALRLTQGEVRQLYSARALSMTLDESLEIIRDKTGALFSAATLSAALLARAPARERDALALFGEQFGIGYQLADDMLDYLGESRTLGKRRGDDLRDGKVTYPLVLCLSRVDRRQRRRIEGLLARSDCGSDEIDEVVGFMRERDCFEDCAAVAEGALVRGAEALEGIGDGRVRGILQRVCLSSLKRLY